MQRPALFGVALERRSPVLARLLRAYRLPSAPKFWSVALEGLVEAQELAAAAPDDPARRDIVETLEEVFLAASRSTFAREAATSRGAW